MLPSTHHRRRRRIITQSAAATLLVAAFFAAVIGFCILLGTAPLAGGVVALVIAAALTRLYIRRGVTR